MKLFEKGIMAALVTVSVLTVLGAGMTSSFNNNITTTAYAQLPAQSQNTTNNTTITNNTTTTNATTTTTPTTNATNATAVEEEGEAIAVFGIINNTVSDRFLLNASAQALAAQDPQFKNFGDIWRNCVVNLGYGNGTISQFQCSATFEEATGKWCGLEEYHAEKCAHATDMVSGYGLVQGVFSRTGLGIFE